MSIVDDIVAFLVVILLAAAAYGGYSVGARAWEAKYQQLQVQDQAASLKAQQAAATQLAQVTAAYQAKLKGIDDANTAAVAAAAAHSDSLIASLHNYANARGGCPVPGGAGGSRAVPGAPAVPAGLSSIAGLTDRLAAAARSVDDAVANAVRACSADGIELAGAQAERRALSSAPQ
jgi:hypothetical protein